MLIWFSLESSPTNRLPALFLIKGCSDRHAFRPRGHISVLILTADRPSISLVAPSQNSLLILPGPSALFMLEGLRAWSWDLLSFLSTFCLAFRGTSSRVKALSTISVLITPKCMTPAFPSLLNIRLLYPTVYSTSPLLYSNLLHRNPGLPTRPQHLLLLPSSPPQWTATPAFRLLSPNSLGQGWVLSCSPTPPPIHHHRLLLCLQCTCRMRPLLATLASLTWTISWILNWSPCFVFCPHQSILNKVTWLIPWNPKPDHVTLPCETLHGSHLTYNGLQGPTGSDSMTFLTPFPPPWSLTIPSA